ncbi:hypothetical protein CDAR_587101 [Caerostris darwini]|uniref:Uncharacterized protein n=1 Tax=Caerostris darwini TaxID=1538125 RepID=A0AAV4SWZ4_9ARAC|nr:hypothetical protein CDAR_587101 [Caerostris darwini]
MGGTLNRVRLRRNEKTLFGGMTTEVLVKFMAPQSLHRTPILITSNKDIWFHCSGDEEALRNRFIQYMFNETATTFSTHSREWWQQPYRTYCEWCTNLDNYLKCRKQVYTSVSECTEPEGVIRRRGPREQFPPGDEYSDPEYPVYHGPNQPSPPSLECNTFMGSTIADDVAATEARVRTAPTAQDLQAIIAPQLRTMDRPAETLPEIAQADVASPHTNFLFIEDVERLENLLALEQSENSSSHITYISYIL